MKARLSIAAISIVCCALMGAAANAATTSTTSVSPQRSVAENWVRYMNKGDERAACELQTAKDAAGYSCDKLPTVRFQHCPKAQAGAKPPYRQSEVRSVAEQVGEYTEESATRGFVVINAQVKSSKQRGALGLEQVAGAWQVTYLRQGSETFAPAGNAYQGKAWRKLWVSNWCPTNRPQWEKNK